MDSRFTRIKCLCLHIFDNPLIAEAQAKRRAEKYSAARREAIRHEFQIAARAANDKLTFLLVMMVFPGFVLWPFVFEYPKQGGVIIVVALGTTALVGFSARFPWKILSARGMRSHLSSLECNNQKDDATAGREMSPDTSQKAAKVISSPVAPVVLPKFPNSGSREFWHQLGWWDFEIAVLLIFEKKYGCKVQATSPGNDGGLDGVVYNDRGPAGLQCKHFASYEKVNVEQIRCFAGALLREKFSRGFFVTTGGYTYPAQNEVRAFERPGGLLITLLTVEDLVVAGREIGLTPEHITQAKFHWNLPQQPPIGMRPQRIQNGQKRSYRKRRRGRWR